MREGASRRRRPAERSARASRARAVRASAATRPSPPRRSCGAAGVTRGALYHHFRGKRDLFEAVFEQLEQETCREDRGGGAHRDRPLAAAAAPRSAPSSTPASSPPSSGSRSWTPRRCSASRPGARSRRRYGLGAGAGGPRARDRGRADRGAAGRAARAPDPRRADRGGTDDRPAPTTRERRAPRSARAVERLLRGLCASRYGSSRSVWLPRLLDHSSWSWQGMISASGFSRR